MADLSTQGREDATAFVQAFPGSHRFVLDYLAEEVLRQQPEEICRILRQTAILDRLSDPLCDAVSGKKDGKALLAHLEQSILFIIPLDDDRRWYRYHHLFADVLHQYLQEEQPDHIATLHRRASLWYEAHDH